MTELKKLLKNKKLLLVAGYIILSAVIDARAGGAGRSGGGRSSGGYSSSGGGGGDGIEVIFLIIRLLMIRSYDPLPVKIIKLVIIAGLIYGFVKYTKSQKDTRHIQKNRYTDYSLNKNSLKEAKVVEGEQNFKERNPDFSKEKFIQKVNKAFLDIQLAWTQKDLSNVRRYISDSVYQRFNVQFEMMNALEQIDKINKITVQSIVIDKYEQDGDYDVLHVGIMADIIDSSHSTKFRELNEYAEERFVEYWSFIRRKGTEGYDMYSGENCPKCGAPLGHDMGEVSKCGSCGVITNKGDYDWVLAEITQMTDYLEEKEIKSERSLIAGLKELSTRDKDFSVQHIEDKASNGYLQILKAIALNKPEGMKRFLHPDLFEKLRNEKSDFIYSRMYLNYVKLIGYNQEDNKDILSIRIKSSYKRVQINDNKLSQLDSFMKSKVEILIFERAKDAVNKGDLYSHSCPNCGGPLDDTLDTNCPYCDAPLASNKHDWLIKDIVSPSEFASTYSTQQSKFGGTAPLEKNNFSINEIILNNILLVIYADGGLHSREIEFTKETAKKLGFKESVLDTLLRLAKQGRLSLKFPRTEREKTKMLTYMRKAMNADGKITPEEEKLIKEIEETLVS